MEISQIRFLTQNQESGTRKSKSPHSGICYLELLSITLSNFQTPKLHPTILTPLWKSIWTFFS
jgi:hypothetical protein